jgi:hypothetical protein
MLNNVIETIEPYVIPVAQVAEIYLDAAFSAVSPERPAEMGLCHRAQQECKLMRVASSGDLVQLSQINQDRGFLHRARVTGTRLLMRLEAFADNLGQSGASASGDDGMGLAQLRRCHSDSDYSSSCSESLVSSMEDTDSLASEKCLTAGEIIPRAIILPVILQMQLVRLVYDKATSVASMTTAMGCNILQRCALSCAQRSVAFCQRAVCLVDGFLGHPPCVRVMILALTDKDDAQESKHEGSQPDALQPQPISSANTEGGTGCGFSNANTEGGTGCCTH